MDNLVDAHEHIIMLRSARRVPLHLAHCFFFFFFFFFFLFHCLFFFLPF